MFYAPYLKSAPQVEGVNPPFLIRVWREIVIRYSAPSYRFSFFMTSLIIFLIIFSFARFSRWRQRRERNPPPTHTHTIVVTTSSTSASIAAGLHGESFAVAIRGTVVRSPSTIHQQILSSIQRVCIHRRDHRHAARLNAYTRRKWLCLDETGRTSYR
jgi:DNA-binding transcriptional LysR family regulator